MSAIGLQFLNAMAPQRPTRHDSQRTRATPTHLRRVAFAGAFFLWLLFGWTNPANATTYSFPGSLPAGCSGSDGTYTCAPLTLNANDTITIGAPAPTTITVNGGLDTSGASINFSASPGNLKLVVTGVLTLGSGAKISALVTAGSVSNRAGGASLVGSIATDTGEIRLGDTFSMSGSITSNIGVIFIGDYADVKGDTRTSGAITYGNYSTITGSIIGTGSGAITAGLYTNVTGVINTGGAITIGDHSNVKDVTSTAEAVTVGPYSNVTGPISASGAVTVGSNSRIGDVTSTSGALTVGVGANVSGSIIASGAVVVGSDAEVSGSIGSTAGALTLGANSKILSCVRSANGAAISITAGASVNSVCCGAMSACTADCVTGSPIPPLCSPPSAGPHHLEIRHGSGTGLTCTSSILTVVACEDASCSTPYTGGVNGTLTASGSGMTVNLPSGASFGIPSGSGSITKEVQITTVGSVMFGASGSVPSPVSPSTCNFGNPACTFTVADAGFIVELPNHVSDAAQSLVVRAVRKSDNTAACVPALTGNKSLNFSCAYMNPSVGTFAVRVGDVALNAANNASSACDTNGRAVNLTFNASGVASTNVRYADVGQMQLNARFSGTGGSAAGLVMTGTNSFITAPASFAFSAISAGPIKAGNAFAATASAINSSGSVTPNFGNEATPESAALAFTRAQPSGSGASNGVFTGSLGAFSAGMASANNLVWSEVGRGDLSATLSSASYLGSGITASGTTGSAGAVGRFTPHHFEVVVTPACTSFTYAAQPFNVRVTAKNGLAGGATTVNYDGTGATTPNFSQPVSLSDAPALGLGSFSGTGALPASLFSAGVANTLSPAYSFTSKLTAAQTLVVRAIDGDTVSSAGYTEGSTALRSGRLRLSNAFGSEKSLLALTVQAQYWSGNAWVANSADNCSVVPASAVVRSGYVDNKGAPTTAWSTTASGLVVMGGNAVLTLSAPSPTLTGSVDLTLNLGATSADQSCLAAHPASNGAALPWLRSQNGGCSTAWDRDPSARATFGIYAPETRKIMHVREIF